MFLQLENNGTLTPIKELKFLNEILIHVDLRSKVQKMTEDEFNTLVSKILKIENFKENCNRNRVVKADVMLNSVKGVQFGGTPFF